MQGRGLLVLVALSLASAQLDSWLTPDESWECSKLCAHDRCTDHTIRYGNFCGAVHAGCEGVQPCDKYDACCQKQNACVDAAEDNESDLQCHHNLISCLDETLEAGAETWIHASLRQVPDTKLEEASATCNATTVVNSLTEAMRIAILFNEDVPLHNRPLNNRALEEPQQNLESDEMDEDSWRAQVHAGVRRYDPRVDAAFHDRKLSQMAEETGMKPLDQVANKDLLPGIGAGGPPDFPGDKKGRVVPLPNGEHVHFQPKANGGFRMAFKPTKDQNFQSYDPEADAARHAGILRERHAARFSGYKHEL